MQASGFDIAGFAGSAGSIADRPLNATRTSYGVNLMQPACASKVADVIAVGDAGRSLVRNAQATTNMRAIH